MIRVSANLYKKFIDTSKMTASFNKFYFAKQPKEGGKKGGKQEKKAETPAVPQQPTQKLLPYERILNYFTPLQPGLSPSQQQSLQNKFGDLSQQQKQILDNLAEKIVELNTSMFYDFVYKKGGMGTSQALVLGSGKFQENEIKEAIKVLRKDI